MAIGRRFERALAEAWSFRWSFRQAQHHMTGPCRLDYPSDLTCEDATLRDGVDGCGSTSNPVGCRFESCQGRKAAGHSLGLFTTLALWQSLGCDGCLETNR